MAIGSNSEPKEGCPSFFKTIRYPSAPHLKLPEAFVRMYLEKIPKNPILKTKTATGEHLWKLKVIKSGDDYCFADGWDELVKDAQLCSKDIVVFWLVDPYTFQVLFLDANGCDKDLPIKNSNTDDGDHTVDGHDDEEDLCFEKIISRTKYHMTLPKKFVKAAGLENKTSIKMKNQEGKEWTVGILAERYHRTRYSCRHSLTAKWLEFRRYNQLWDGDNCLFKFNKKEGVLYLAQVIKSKTSVKQETSMDGVNGTRGRPPFNGVKVKMEYESRSEVEAEKRNRGRPPMKQPDGGVANVKIENESVPEMDRWIMSKHVVYF